MNLELYLPIKPFLVTQKFGETASLSYYKSNGINFKGHNGIDVAATHGQSIRASHDGWCSVEVDNNQGHGVVITTNTAYAYKGKDVYFKTIYWHMIDNIPVKNGQQVKAGDVIGYANSTGLSTGDHLHWALKPCDKKGNTLEFYNGYYGCIDPWPYALETYAQDIGKKFEEHFAINLQRGDESAEVTKLQNFLADLNYLPRSCCIGIFGPQTQKALGRFQEDFGVLLTFFETPGKYFGPKTRKVANSLYPPKEIT